jgi:hypothetical protein
MELYFDHICGKQADYDFLHCLVSATVEKGEEQEALDKGWCPSNIWYNQDTNFLKDNKIIWYQSRQARLDISKHKKVNKETKCWKRVEKSNIKIEVTKTPDFEKLYKIYLKYVTYKKFTHILSEEDFYNVYNTNSDIYILYGDVAFTTTEIVGRSLIAHQFCWDYADPTLGLGRFSTYREISLAKDLNLKYLYIGPSYESHAKYKSSFPGFEFWTGRKWCADKDIFNNLIENDETRDNIENITEYYDYYFKLLNI